MKKILILLFLPAVLFTSMAFKESSSATKIQWKTVEEVSTEWQQSKKPILVDVYTDWCYYCKVMDNTVYRNDSVARFINNHFYAVKLDAESKSSMNWMGKIYNYNKKYAVNELAISLTKGNLSYPTTVIIPVEGDPQHISGAISVQNMEAILRYFQEDLFGKKEWEQFIKTFTPSW